MTTSRETTATGTALTFSSPETADLLERILRDPAFEPDEAAWTRFVGVD